MTETPRRHNQSGWGGGRGRGDGDSEGTKRWRQRHEEGVVVGEDRLREAEAPPGTGAREAGRREGERQGRRPLYIAPLSSR